MSNHLEYTFLIGPEQTVKVEVFVKDNAPPQALMDDLAEKLQAVKEAWKRKVMAQLEQELQDQLPF